MRTTFKKSSLLSIQKLSEMIIFILNTQHETAFRFITDVFQKIYDTL